MKKERNFTRQLIIAYSSAMLVLVITIFTVVFFILYDDAVQKEIGAQQEFILKTQQQVDTSLQNMDHVINGLLYNKAFMRIMHSGHRQTSSIQDSNEVLRIMISLDAPLFLSHRIIAFTPEAAGSYFNISKTGDDHAYIQNAILSYPHYGQLLQADGDRVILPAHADPFDPSGAPVYSVARTVTDGINAYGFIEVQNNIAQLETLCGVGSGLGDIVLLSRDGDVICPQGVPFAQALPGTQARPAPQALPGTQARPDPQALPGAQARPAPQALPSAQESSFYGRLYQGIAARQDESGYFQQDGYQISYTVSKYSGWITVMYCPLSALRPDATLIGAFLLSLTAVLVSMTALINILTKRMAAPLSELNRQISQISFENLSMSMPQYNIIEIENITRSFQTMLNHLKEEIARNAESRANEERANYIALQSQMNPHTIYNTIAMIESVCYINGDIEASRLCIAFSKMLRYITDNTKGIYTVQDELRHLENYAALMKKRYEDGLVIGIYCDPMLLCQVIPKFTFQPLVENAIKHGMNRDSQPFTIRVTVETTPVGWHAVVTDNGTGFADGKIPDIYAQFAQCDQRLLDHQNDLLKAKIDNMALNNIYIRWKILMGERFRIEINNNRDSGCTIKLSVAAEKEESANGETSSKETANGETSSRGPANKGPANKEPANKESVRGGQKIEDLSCRR